MHVQHNGKQLTSSSQIKQTTHQCPTNPLPKTTLLTILKERLRRLQCVGIRAEWYRIKVNVDVFYEIICTTRAHSPPARAEKRNSGQNSCGPPYTLEALASVMTTSSDETCTATGGAEIRSEEVGVRSELAAAVDW